jgi:hypothetical protein
MSTNYHVAVTRRARLRPRAPWWKLPGVVDKSGGMEVQRFGSCGLSGRIASRSSRLTMQSGQVLGRLGVSVVAPSESGNLSALADLR